MYSFTHFFFIPTILLSQIAEGIAVVRPKETDSVLTNPGIGFNTFQHFNGDSLFPGSGWEEGYPIKYQHYSGTLLNKNHPSTSIAYWRVYWTFIEPEQGKYRWDLVEQALDG